LPHLHHNPDRVENALRQLWQPNQSIIKSTGIPMNRSPLDELSEQLARLLPQANALGEEFRASVKLAMEKTFSKMDLLTREEFEAQSRALQRAEEKIAELELAIREIEEKLQK